MPNKNKWFLLFLPALILISPDSTFAQNESASKPIEVFSHGKEYKSIDDYKLEGVRGKIRSLFASSDELAINKVLEQLMKNYSAAQLSELSEPDLMKAIKKIKEENQKVSYGTPQESDIEQMKNILAEYNTQNKDEKPLAIDPNKVKTIIIEPSKTNLDSPQ